MAAKLESAFPGSTVELIPGGRGDFIVTVDGKQLWDKRQMGGEFPEEPALIASLGASS